MFRLHQLTSAALLVTELLLFLLMVPGLFQTMPVGLLFLRPVDLIMVHLGLMFLPITDCVNLGLALLPWMVDQLEVKRLAYFRMVNYPLPASIALNAKMV